MYYFVIHFFLERSIKNGDCGRQKKEFFFFFFGFEVTKESVAKK